MIKQHKTWNLSSLKPSKGHRLVFLTQQNWSLLGHRFAIFQWIQNLGTLHHAVMLSCRFVAGSNALCSSLMWPDAYSGGENTCTICTPASLLHTNSCHLRYLRMPNTPALTTRMILMKFSMPPIMMTMMTLMPPGWTQIGARRGRGKEASRRARGRGVRGEGAGGSRGLGSSKGLRRRGPWGSLGAAGGPWAHLSEDCYWTLAGSFSDPVKIPKCIWS